MYSIKTKCLAFQYGCSTCVYLFSRLTKELSTYSAHITKKSLVKSGKVIVKLGKVITTTW